MTRMKLVSISSLLIFIKGFLISLTTPHLKTKILSQVLKVVNLIVVFSRNTDDQNIIFFVWSLGNSQKLLKIKQFLVSTIFFTIVNISFFSLRFDLFSIIAKEVSQIRNNVVCVVARLVFLFCYAPTTGRCNVFQHNFEN